MIISESEVPQTSKLLDIIESSPILSSIHSKLCPAKEITELKDMYQALTDLVKNTKELFDIWVPLLARHNPKEPLVVWYNKMHLYFNVTYPLHAYSFLEQLKWILKHPSRKLQQRVIQQEFAEVVKMYNQQAEFYNRRYVNANPYLTGRTCYICPDGTMVDVNNVVRYSPTRALRDTESENK